MEVNGGIKLGDRVVVRDCATGELLVLQLVRPIKEEVNPLGGWISVASPLGNALLGKHQGQRVEVEAPVGLLTFEIIEVNGQV